jgi:hypothetical protein
VARHQILALQNAASCDQQNLPNTFILHVILQIKAMSVLAFYRSAKLKIQKMNV